VPVFVSPVVGRQELGKCTRIITRQRLSKNVIAAMNTLSTMEELLDSLLCVRFVSYQGKQAISSPQNILLAYSISQLIGCYAFFSRNMNMRKR
jgi:hypothetical protein